MKKYIFLLASVVFAAACTQENGFVEPQELGVEESSATLSCVAGKYEINVLSDGDFTASIGDDGWLSFSGTEEHQISGNGDCVVTVKYDINRGIERTADVVLTRGRKKVTVTLCQQGVLSSEIAFSSHSVTIDCDASHAQSKILSIYRDDKLSISVEYEGDAKGWLSNVVKENNYISFDALENAQDDSRVAWIVVTYTEDASVSDRLQVVQFGQGAVLQPMDFEQVRDLLSENGSLVISENIVISGWNIGDNKEGNGGENLNVSASIQDLTLTERTIYLEDFDGEYGFKIVFDESSDNILSRFEKVEFCLNGVTLTRLGGGEDDPLRYEISSAKSSNILQTEEGSIYDLKTKEKSISQLTDADLYTLVTLKDCEIPVRKGPFIPIDIRHTFIIHSYPMVLRDRNGDNTHIMTNTTASWQRDGEGLPQGSGTVSGVIVHETCDNFEWNNDLAAKYEAEGRITDYITGIGNIGRYQIRPFSRSEINLAEDFKDGFSEMIMEIRYFSVSSSNPIVQNASNSGSSCTIYPTYPAVESPISDPSVNGKLRVLAYDWEDNVKTASIGNIALWRDWTHLGPMADGEITDPDRGNGVEDIHGVKSEWTPYSTVSTTALIMKSSAWYSSNGWNTERAWTASFSTEELTSDNLPLSVQFGCCNGLGQTVGAPRYWLVQYSYDGYNWNEAGEYTVPDFPILSNRKPWQCPGFKYVSVTLPYDDMMIGQTEVYVRLRPLSDLAGTSTSYDGGSIVNGRETELNYFAIRYNK